MAQLVGHFGALKPSQKAALKRLGAREVPADKLVTKELLRMLCKWSHTLGRQLGVLIDRQGHIVSVNLGEADRVYLPDIGRSRAGRTSLRGVRHVHTYLHPQGQVVGDDIADLQQLRLDGVLVIGMTAYGEPSQCQLAMLAPQQQQEAGSPYPVRRLEMDWLQAGQLDWQTELFELERAFGQKASKSVISAHREGVLAIGVYRRREEIGWRLGELTDLLHTAGLELVDSITQVRAKPDPHYVLGKGKLDEAMRRCVEKKIDLMVVDGDMSPAQGRAMSQVSKLRILDRTQLILDIFAQHARSRDGKLQVELAQLRYQLPRLTDLDAGLSRLTGGIGGRGPGETKLEINRRRARERIARLERELQEVRKQRNMRRQRRLVAQELQIAVVGYTNAGKSSLIGTLCRQEMGAADQLFATLDPVARRWAVPNVTPQGELVPISGKPSYWVLLDTVGFITDLPATLMEAFEATLAEMVSARLLWHVIDVSDPRWREQQRTVEQTLADLSLGHLPKVIVLHKIDQISPQALQIAQKETAGVGVSSHQKLGFAPLIVASQAALAQAQSLENQEIPEVLPWAESGSESD